MKEKWCRVNKQSLPWKGKVELNLDVPLGPPSESESPEGHSCNVNWPQLTLNLVDTQTDIRVYSGKVSCSVSCMVEYCTVQMHHLGLQRLSFYRSVLISERAD